MRLLATLASLATCGFLAGCGEQAALPAVPTIVGTWEQVVATMRDSPGEDFSFDDVDPTALVQASFRANGIFTARYEGDGRVTSVIGTWRRSGGDGGVGSDRFVVRLATVDGVAVPAEIRDRRVEVLVSGPMALRDGVTQSMGPGTASLGSVQTLWLPAFDSSSREFTSVRLTLSRQR